jgi:hypothetical protein
MIKIENDMLVLDNTFTKEDVQAIDEFVKINVDRERQRLVDILHDYGTRNYISESTYHELVALVTDSVY